MEHCTFTFLHFNTRSFGKKAKGAALMQQMEKYCVGMGFKNRNTCAIRENHDETTIDKILLSLTNIKYES